MTPLFLDMGDLQDIVSKTSVDKHNNKPRDTHKRGMLRWCINKNRKSVGHKQARMERKKYINREGTKGKVGLCHAMCNEPLKNCIQDFIINDTSIHLLVGPSVHYALILD